mgnify:CR=1 FL=1
MPILWIAHRIHACEKMSVASTIVKNTFEKIFTNLVKEMDAPVGKLLIGIYYHKGQQRFEVFNHLKKEKDIDISEYCGALIDWSGGSIIIETTIAQAGAKYAKELSVDSDDIKIIMQYKEKCLPNAVLMAKGEKVRNINIEREFLT